MKLEKTEYGITAELTDSCDTYSQTKVTITGQHEECWVALDYKGKEVLAKFKQPELEQLIYVLTLARNRMT